MLKRKPRLQEGWAQRLVEDAPQGPFDLWIQAASGGEALLTNMILDEFRNFSVTEVPKRILVTSGTREGVDSLKKGLQQLGDTEFEVVISYFPFDAPFLMKKAFARFTPRLAILLETELWPGFLTSAYKRQIPVYLVNGRMSDKSVGSYRKFKSFFHSFGPEKVLAISELDSGRFQEVMGEGRVERMNNIKFDRINPIYEAPGNPEVTCRIPDDSPLVLFGSVRREEEEKILETIALLHKRRPDVTMAIFPKQIDRTESWEEMLLKNNISCCRRSEISAPGSERVILWDVFGELAGAYNMAQAAFIGGSLVNLGGQNFLEPLVFGLKPITGPSWRNFGWVGQEIFTRGLVIEVQDEIALVDALIEQLEQPQNRAEVLEKVVQYFQPKKGGTRFVCQQILHKFQTTNNQ